VIRASIYIKRTDKVVGAFLFFPDLVEELKCPQPSVELMSQIISSIVPLRYRSMLALAPKNTLWRVRLIAKPHWSRFVNLEKFSYQQLSGAFMMEPIFVFHQIKKLSFVLGVQRDYQLMYDIIPVHVSYLIKMIMCTGKNHPISLMQN